MRFNAPSRRGEALESAFFSFSTAISSLFSPFLSSLLFLFSLTHKQNLIFRFLQSRQTVQIWLYEQADLRIEGLIIVSVSLLLNFHRSRSKRRRQRFLFSTSSLDLLARSLSPRCGLRLFFDCISCASLSRSLTNQPPSLKLP